MNHFIYLWLCSLVENYYANPLNPMVGLNCCPGRVRLTSSFDPAFQQRGFLLRLKTSITFRFFSLWCIHT